MIDDVVETNYTQLQVKIPILSYKSAELFKTHINSELNVFPKIDFYETSDLNTIYITFIFFGVENADDIEKIMDNYVNEYTRIRYSIFIYQQYKKFPKSIRINKRGRKIVTKEQKKTLGL